ncbi:outer membrane beta-barrel protein [Arcticibacter eurypsychrophilus]|uniref:outer membrane beta-barrel protein n=1 Tax=Arcticibacter eurypsychrophilus TaxID=1434752 RepID=UPI00084DC09D|nr:outer membrane beta-barrel protein [Arcticibacter eurypsychrophilus]
MKPLVLFSLFLVCIQTGFASFKPDTTIKYSSSSDSTITRSSSNSDTTVIKKSKNVRFEWSIGKNDSDSSKSIRTHRKAPGVIYGLTLSRFDLGFSKLVYNGSFTLSDANNFLEYNGWKTTTVGFDLLQFGYRFNSSFKIYLAAGFDWTLIRLKKNITMSRNSPVLAYEVSDVEFDKNRFSSTYIRLPLSFEWRSKDDNRGNKFRLIAGPDMGFLLNGKVKQKSSENGKQKFNDNYHFATFRYGAFARIGYGGTGLFAKYYFNDMFENSPAQEGLQNMSFGVSLGF